LGNSPLKIESSRRVANNIPGSLRRLVPAGVGEVLKCNGYSVQSLIDILALFI
jgi:hypothetical protein